MTDDETEGEETVVLSRRDRRRAGGASDAADEQPLSDADEATIVVNRAKTSPEAVSDGAPDDATIVVDRSAAPTSDAPDESTVVVSRPARRLRRERVDVAGTGESESHETATTRRVESFAAPTDGPAPAIYKPRPAPLVPVAPPVVVGAAAPTRVEDPGLPSVAKQGQRWSLLTLVAAAGACVVSVAGLVGLGFVVFG